MKSQLCLLVDMQESLDPSTSVLYAQVRKAGPSHGHDEEGHLRLKAHPSNVTSVWLGDVTTTLLRVVSGVSTPLVQQSPRFDEQRWIITAKSGDLNLEVESLPYWGFGLITRCYLNKITLRGPLEQRARIVYDLVSSLGHKPWEVSRKGSFNRKIGEYASNEKSWKEHIERAKWDLNEMIENTLSQKGESPEIEIARNALADDNAPAVLRALARLEADSIDIEIEEVDPDGAVYSLDEAHIPLVDLSSEEE